MKTCTYKEKTPIDRYRIIETIEQFNYISSWEQPGTSLIYFRVDRFNIKTVSKSDIISID